LSVQPKSVLFQYLEGWRTLDSSPTPSAIILKKCNFFRGLREGIASRPHISPYPRTRLSIMGVAHSGA
jgi:hypothetical protein